MSTLSVVNTVGVLIDATTVIFSASCSKQAQLYMATPTGFFGTVNPGDKGSKRGTGGSVRPGAPVRPGNLMGTHKNNIILFIDGDGIVQKLNLILTELSAQKVAITELKAQNDQLVSRLDSVDSRISVATDSSSSKSATVAIKCPKEVSVSPGTAVCIISFNLH